MEEKMSNSNHERWMRVALEEAEKARLGNELPIGGVLVANDQVIGLTQTNVARKRSLVAHGELLALLEANGRLYSAPRPIVLYTTLEPCLMCLGAAINSGIDEIVIGMMCAPDGGTPLVDSIVKAGLNIPKITKGVLENECVNEWRKWDKGSSHPAHSYWYAILKPYEK